MKSRFRLLVAFPLVFAAVLISHISLLRLPYFWDEAGYYVPAALDFYRHGLLIPRLTLPSGHTPLVSVYLGSLWHLFGFSEPVTRVGMLVIAAATVVTTYELGRRVADRETGVWAALLLALSPLFFAQSSLVFLDLAAALFTTLAAFLAFGRRWGWFAIAASLAVMSKETALILLPVIWVFMLLRARERRAMTWTLSAVPAILLALWAFYYRSKTGFWTGNAEYLQYNLYSALTPLHIARSLVARIAEIFVQGFNWFVVAGAVAGVWWARRVGEGSHGQRPPDRGPLLREETPTVNQKSIDRGYRLPLPPSPQGRGPDKKLQMLTLSLGGSRRVGMGEGAFGNFLFLAVGLIAVYVITLSLVGGAVLPRYLLPVFPISYVLAAALIARLPRRAARLVFAVAAACFVASWFINPPYPFPYEDNLAYTSFIRLHERAAKFLESLPNDPVILTAWPATDELKQPFLGYVSRPLRVGQVDDFTHGAFTDPPRFEVLYLYSRKWEPPDNWLRTTPVLRAIGRRFYQYEPAEPPDALASRFHLRLLKQFGDRGQWVKIYAMPSWDPVILSAAKNPRILLFRMQGFFARSPRRPHSE